MDLDRLIAVQNKLAREVILEDRFGEIEKIAGCDVAYDGDRAFSAAVVLDYASLEVIEESVVQSRVTFPYIPTFLAFREAKPLMKAIERLKNKFDVLLLDGHGMAHPRGLGIASHLGVALNVPTIGVAKRILCGEVRGKIQPNKPAQIFYNGRHVGYAMQTKKNTAPLYISPGTGVSLDSSLKIVAHCIKKHKLPEPLRLAHNLALLKRSESRRNTRFLANANEAKEGKG